MSASADGIGIDPESYREIDVLAAEFLLSLKIAPQTKVHAWQQLAAGGFVSAKKDKFSIADRGSGFDGCDVDVVFEIYEYESARKLERGCHENVSLRDGALMVYAKSATRMERRLAPGSGYLYDQEKVAKGLDMDADIMLDGKTKVFAMQNMPRDIGEGLRPREFANSPAKFVESVLVDGVSAGYRGQMTEKKIAAGVTALYDSQGVVRGMRRSDPAGGLNGVAVSGKGLAVKSSRPGRGGVAARTGAGVAGLPAVKRAPQKSARGAEMNF